MGKPRALLRLVDHVIWLGAGTGLWLYLNNRFVLHWSSSTVKSATMALLAIGLFVLALLGRAHKNRILWRRVAVLVVCLFTVGELHRAWLRYRCRGRAEEVANAATTDLSRPWTTTDLLSHRRIMSVPQGIGRLRVAHLTDLHIAPSIPWAYYQSIVERTNAEAPDVVLLTGDYLSKAEYLPLLTRWLALPLRARLGVYAVLGNHDYWAGAASEVRQALTAANVRVLSGSCARLAGSGADHVVLCGTEWPWGRDFVAPNVSGDDLVVVMSHTPDNVYALRGRAHAVFAGHYHGGQWRIPGVGALIVPSVFGRRFDLGDFSVGGTELFVSAGVGADYPPLRVYCPPEVLVVDFAGASAAVAATVDGTPESRRLD